MKHNAPLSPAARELLELGSHVEPPRGEQIERMDRALARLIALERVAPPASPGLQRGSFGTRVGRGAASSTAAPAWRALDHLLGPGAGKLAFTLGALAATASAAFWVGRVSAPEPLQAPGTGSLSAAHPPAGEAALAEPTAIDPSRAVLSPRAEEEAPTAQHPPERAGAALAANTAGLESAGAAERAAAAGATPSAVTANAVAVSAFAAGAVSPPVRQRASLGVKPITSSGLAAEVEQLARAEAALRQGRAQRALAELEPPAIHLVEQATAIRAVAECALGQLPSAPSAREVLQRWPGSAFAPRIRAACGL